MGGVFQPTNMIYQGVTLTYVSKPVRVAFPFTEKPTRKPFQEGVERPEDGNSDERPENAPLQGNEVPQQEASDRILGCPVGR